jgi:RTX calcium-binding nonapeptide repeat (4 copies)
MRIFKLTLTALALMALAGALDLGGGDDVAEGSDGDDVLHGGPGKDRLGADRKDTLTGCEVVKRR